MTLYRKMGKHLHKVRNERCESESGERERERERERAGNELGET